MRTTRTLLVGLAAGAMTLTGVGVASASTKAPAASKTIVIGNEGFTESDIMQYVYGDLLSNIGYTVKYQSTESRQIAIPALEKGTLNVVPDYAGSLAMFVAPSKDDATVEKQVGTLAGAIAADNTYLKGAVALAGTSGLDQNVFVVTAATKKKDNLSSISSIAKYASSWTFGAPPECSQNYFCAPGLKSIYGISFKTVKSYDESGPLTVAALKSGAAEVVELFSTDSVISADGFYSLSDNKNLEPADHLIPVVSTSLDTAAVKTALASVNSLLTTSELTKLDASASEGSHPTPQAIAESFLKGAKLIK